VQTENVPDHIPLDSSTALYRITQEALRNIAKHANNATVTLKIIGSADALRLTIEDDGPGFASLDGRFRGGLGLISMHERARSVGAVLNVTSSPGQGTRIEVNIPLTEPQQ
jgi:signal transduction histidine kinase